MTQHSGRSHLQAELAANFAQAEFFARDHAVQEEEFLTHAREAKTTRLRQARMEKELKRHDLTLSGLIGRHAKLV
jgi:hypothetical protein